VTITPETVWEHVMVTLRVPAGFHKVFHEDQSGSATVVLNPDEARSVAAWLEQAAAAADEVGPSLYG
jgi:hypothetical protein